MYLEEQEIPHERIAKSLHAATLDLKVTPVLCGSAFKNKGVQPLLDAIVELLPSPLEVDRRSPASIPVKGQDEGNEATRPADDDGPFAALAFKVMTDPFVGKLTYFRVYSGKLEAGSRVLNIDHRPDRAHRPPADDARELARGDRAVLLRRHPRRRRPQADVDRRHARRARSADRRSSRSIFPEPVIAVAIEPKTKVDQEKLATALQRLSEEDPTFRVESDEETGQTVINGMGELHLEVLVDRMMREFKVDATVGKPQVAYRETIRQEANKVQGKFVRQTGGSGQYGDVVINVDAEPRRGLRVRLARSRAARSRPSTSPRSRRASSRRSHPGSRPATRWSTSRSS